MTEQIYTNYRLLLPDEEVLGTLVVRDGAIADIQPDLISYGAAGASIDGNGEYLLPGLVELHTDNLERNMTPRPGVMWPIEAAAVYHDRDLIGAGVTTVCDAISIGDTKPGSIRMTHFAAMIDVIHEGQQADRYFANHLIHLRCELGYDQVTDVVGSYADHPLLTLLSLMDHTPGQRQFVDIEKFKEYYMGKHGVSADEMEGFIQQRLDDQQMHALENRVKLVDLAQSRNLAIASHDDATVDHVKEAVSEGAAISEFPTTMAAAKEAHLNGLQVLMGAPNLVLGGSHSGNVSAMELVQVDLVDIISSDYVPRSLLQSVFLIAEHSHLPLYEAAKLVTSNPARAIGLDSDRGSLSVGKRADFVTVHHDGTVPMLTSVFNGGRRVA
ncbi:MAG: alpha-D-ribose 1-methylphosphonate 5-triphosphate diphosphatase [Synechococcus sp.]